MYLMTLHRIQLSAVAVILFTFFFASGVAQLTSRDAAGRNTTTTKDSSARPVANWTFEGCWQPFLGNPCRDVFRDQQGNYWICRECGSTGHPRPGQCSPN